MIIAPLGGCEFDSLYFNHHASIDVCIPTFNILVFMNSQTVCLFWKEKSSNMDGFSFHLVFFFRKLEGLYNIHLNENSKRP